MTLAGGWRGLAAGLLALLFAPESTAAPPPPPGESVAGTPLFKHAVRDRLGRTLTYYASRPPRPAPILLMIQGSGCGRVVKTANGQSYSTLYNLIPFAAESRFTVVAVEKPFSSEDVNGGEAVKCGADFNATFSAESWLTALQTVLNEVRRRPDVDPRRTVVLGMSEGAVMASLLGGRDPRVTEAIVVSGSGTSQLFDFIVGAYNGCFDRSACLADIMRQVAAIRADPDSATAFAWGHPYKRWTSFFALDPGAELLRSRARVYLALGTADTSVPALSQEVAVARLLAAGRDVTVRRVAGGDHGLMNPGKPDFADLDRELRAALAWVDQSER